MKLEPHQWEIYRDMYLAANGGSLLPGFLHNLNNSSHAIDLQLELLQTKIPKLETGPFPDAGNRLSRIAHASKDLLTLLECMGTRFFFTQQSNVQVDLPSFFQWFIGYWQNNLFFKHKIDLDFSLNPGCPNLDTPPFLLTLCLEEACKNALEACKSQEPDTRHRLGLHAIPQGQGLRISMLSAPPLPGGSDPFESWFTTKKGHLGLGLPLVRYYAELAGWNVDLKQQDNNTLFTLTIPEIRTQL